MSAANVPLWDDASWSPLPPLATTVECDACVVGLGGSGLAAIAELVALGRSVVGLDAGAVGGGAAGRNGGFLLAGMAEFHHDAVARWGRERAARLYTMTLAELERVRTDTPEHCWWTGSLRIADGVDEEADCAAQLAQMHADGLPAEWYEGIEGRGLLIPTDGGCQPLARCRTLARRALQEGARLFEGSPVASIAPGVVRIAGGAEVRARLVIVAVDGGLLRLFPALAGDVRPIRLQMLGTAPVHEVHIPRPVYRRYGFDYWQQLPDGRVVFGGGRDRFEAESETDDPTPTSTVQGYLEDTLRGHIGVHERITHRWAATVSYTRDLLPVVRQMADGVWAVGGYSGTGNLVGAMAARAVVRQGVLGGEDPVLRALTTP